MSRNDVATAAMNGVELVASWLTPTVLFCFLNLMIGTIFITSSLKPQKKQNLGDNDDLPPPHVARVPSFLDRAKSFKLSRYESEQTEPVHYAVPAQEQAAQQVDPEHENEELHHVSRSKSARVPSFLERVKSFKLSKYGSEQTEQVHYAVPAQEQAAQQVDSEHENEEPHHVSRSKSAPVTSFLERVKSLKLSRYGSEQTEPVHYAVPAQEQAAQQVDPEHENEELHHVSRSKSARAPSFLERVKSFKLSKYGSEQTEQVHYAVPAQEQAAQQVDPEHENEELHHVSRSKSARAPSFLERVKSFKLSKYGSEQIEQVHYAVPAQEQATQHVDPEHENEELHHVSRSKSDTAAKTAPAARVLKKSASEKVTTAKEVEVEVEVEEVLRRPATVREKTAASREEDEAVDAKADDFINRFRQQLKLQRLDSILRYKEMLSRGTKS